MIRHLISGISTRLRPPASARGPERNPVVEQLDQWVDKVRLLPGGLFQQGLQKVTDSCVQGVGLSPYHLVQLERTIFKGTCSEVDEQGRVTGPPRYLSDLFGANPHQPPMQPKVGRSRTSEWVGIAASGAFGSLAQSALFHCWKEARTEEISRHRDFTNFHKGPQGPKISSQGRERTLVLFEQRLRSLEEGNAEERARVRYLAMVDYLENVRPDLEKNQPELARAIENSVARLTPAWSERDNDDWLGWRVDATAVYKTYGRLSQGEKLQFAAALDSQILALEKSYWVKLLSEGSPAQRQECLEPLMVLWESTLISQSREALGTVLLNSLKALNQAERQPYLDRLRRAGPTEQLTTELAALGWRCPKEVQNWLAGSGQTVILGPYWEGREIPSSLTQAGPRPREGIVLGQRSGMGPGEWALCDTRPQTDPVPVTLVLEGGGGKGFAFAPMLRGLMNQLAEVNGHFSIDSFCGTSAGAITATLLAAGYSPQELEGVMSSIAFREFFSDAHGLATGDDPAAGAASRVSLFTTRRMEESLRQLLQEKLQIFDRPVTFQDLPYGLKMPSTVLAGNLPPDLLEQLQYKSSSGQVVFSQETTPMMDVAAAAAASGAFPFNFQPPILEFTRATPEGKVEQYWLQVTDGGVVNNFPLDLARSEAESTCTVVLPTPYEDLVTLGFDPTDARSCEPRINALFDQQGPALRRFLASREDAGRIVFGLDLQKNEAPIVVVGDSSENSQRYREQADQAGLETGCPEQWQLDNRPQAPGWLVRNVARLGAPAERKGLAANPVDTIAGMLRTLVERQAGAASAQE